MNEGQLADLRRIEGATLALLRRRVAGVPHEVVGDEQPASLKRVQQCYRSMFANERRGTIHLDHGEPPPGGCNRVAFFCVSLFTNPQCVELRLECAPINYLGCSEFVSHKVRHRSLSSYTGFEFFASRFRKAASPASDTSTHFGWGAASAA